MHALDQCSGMELESESGVMVPDRMAVECPFGWRRRLHQERSVLERQSGERHCSQCNRCQVKWTSSSLFYKVRDNRSNRHVQGEASDERVDGIAIDRAAEKAHGVTNKWILNGRLRHRETRVHRRHG